MSQSWDEIQGANNPNHIPTTLAGAAAKAQADAGRWMPPTISWRSPSGGSHPIKPLPLTFERRVHNVSFVSSILILVGAYFSGLQFQEWYYWLIGLGICHLVLVILFKGNKWLFEAYCKLIALVALVGIGGFLYWLAK